MNDFPDFQMLVPDEPQGGLNKIVQKLAARKRPLLLGGAVLAVLVIGFMWLTPRSETSAAVSQASPMVTKGSESSWTPSPEPSSLSDPSATVGDPDEVVDYVRKALEKVTAEQQIDALWARLGIEKGSPVAIAQTARTGDFALVTVVGVRTTGEVRKVQCEVQRDASGWRIREVQAAG